MQFGRLKVENSLPAIRRGAPGLLDDEGQWIGLVQQTELAPRRLSVRRIGEDATAKQVSMEVRHQRSNIPGAERLSIAVQSLVLSHQRPNMVVPQLLVRVVDRQIATTVGNPDIRM